MTKERFAEICIEEGYTAEEAEKLWDAKPAEGPEPRETGVRFACQVMLERFQLVRELKALVESAKQREVTEG